MNIEQATAAPGEVRELPHVERVELLSLQPGDKVILTMPVHASAEQAAEVRAIVQQKFPDHEVIVLGGGLELKVARSA